MTKGLISRVIASVALAGAVFAPISPAFADSLESEFDRAFVAPAPQRPPQLQAPASAVPKVQPRIESAQWTVSGSVRPFVAAPRQLSPLDQKIVKHFAGLVVRKDLTKGLKQNAVVPTYVLEYLLGQHCGTDDNEVIKAGLESVQKILAKILVTL